MDPFLSSLLSYILLYRYVALAIAVYLGAMGLPLPVNIALLALGAFASQGYFSFWTSFAIAIAGNVLGDLTVYGVTRRYGDAIVGFFRLRKVKFFVNLEKELRSDAAITVFITRFGSAMSPLTNVLAGVSKVPFLTFLPADIAGNVLEPFGFLAFGYAAGSYWNDLSGAADLIGAIIAVVSVIFILVRMQKRFMRKYEDPGQIGGGRSGR